MSTRSRTSLTTTVPAVVFALLALSTLLANAAQDVVVKIPFDFQAGDTHFAAGQYRLSMDKALTGSVMIQSADGTRRATMLTRKSHFASEDSAPVVSFRGYGESRFLSAIQGECASQRWEIVPTATEASIARTSAPPKVANLKASSPGTK
jgi:hypothetical protein